METRNVIVGFVAALATALLIGWAQVSRDVLAAMERRPHPGVEGEPFFPAVSDSARDVIGAARVLLEARIEAAEGAEVASTADVASDAGGASDGEVASDGAVLGVGPTEAAAQSLLPLIERFPRMDPATGESWILSLYVPRPGFGDADPAERGPWIADLGGGLEGAFESIWRSLPPAVLDPQVLARGRWKLDQVLPGERPFPPDGGHRGVALDEGIDGIALTRLEPRGRFIYLPSWSIERQVQRSKMQGRAQKRARQIASWSKADTQSAEFAAVRTRSWVEAVPGGEIVGLQRGNVDVPEPEAAVLRERIRLAVDYLVRETDDRGKITYDYEATTDDTDGDYNILRHAGTAYSMMQAYRVGPDPAILAAVERAVGYYRRQMREDERNPGEWFVLDGKRAKLGGIGLGLCMLVELDKAVPGAADPALMAGMARHIERMQLPSGEFDSFYDWNGKQKTRRKSIYYSGEALLGLVRYYELTGEERWLDIAERGADFLVHQRWKALGIRFYIPPDAWLIQALEELDRFRPDAARQAYAFAIADAIARNKLMEPRGVPEDLLGADLSGLASLPNAATAGSFGEALAAAARLEARLQPGQTRYRDFALRNARFQLRNQYTVANSYALPNPDRALGGFRKKPDDGEIRNDYVQHNLSGLFGLLDLLDAGAPDVGEVHFDKRGAP